jgi:hypothetical protein
MYGGLGMEGNRRKSHESKRSLRLDYGKGSCFNSHGRAIPLSLRTQNPSPSTLTSCQLPLDVQVGESNECSIVHETGVIRAHVAHLVSICTSTSLLCHCGPP